MLTKLPDYIISDCGYPNWDPDRENLNLVKIHANLWSTSSIWSTKSTNLVKLLPLRETLTDYYMDKLMMRQHESKSKTTSATATTTTNTSTSAQQCSKKMNSNNSGRQTPRHVNELMMIKNGKRKPQQLTSHCALDKRRSHYTNSLDNDLDQF
ncbi:uncharacterized protein LOC111680987 [Lucilia cuprina]|nr:uncharacterized protein LOC111680987 [Lucilia cuprina]XP_046809900.1 uncharacterized protein LOC111680987 [Lucilia cuprina]KAI8115164.1 hypothetical protein CVS40_12574 [Lucilia cuprina]